MFQSVRPNSQIYILHKGDTPKVEVGYVNNMPIVRPKYPMTPMFGQTQESVVDISVKINDNVFNYSNLPAQSDISDSISNGENIAISDNRETINAEIVNLKQKSIDIINSIDHHKEMIIKYDKLLMDINPERAERQEQKEEINILKSQMADMSRSINSLMEANKALIEKLTLKESKDENVGN